MKKFDLISFNIHKGFNTFNTKNTLTLLKEAIKDSGAEVVLLQEVCGQHRKTKEIQFEYLADTVWKNFAYGKNAVYEDGHHGNAILTQFPIVEWTNINLTLHRLEQRGLLHTIIQIPDSDKKIHLLNLHINLFGFHRHQQIQMVINHIDKQIPPNEPMIVAGDFNDWCHELQDYFFDHQFKEAFKEHHHHFATTFPSFSPLLSLDRMFYKNIHCSQAAILGGEKWSKLSDHLAIMGTFEI